MKLLSLVVLSISSMVFAKEVMVHDAYIRLLPPSSKTTGAFMEIMNHSKNDVKLLKVESDFADKVEIHNHIKKDGMMKMVEVKSLLIPANKTVVLKPGSYHIMLIGLKKPLNKKQKAKLKFTFSNKQVEEVLAPIREISMKKTKSDKKHHHHH